MWNLQLIAGGCLQGKALVLGYCPSATNLCHSNRLGVLNNIEHSLPAVHHAHDHADGPYRASTYCSLHRNAVSTSSGKYTIHCSDHIGLLMHHNQSTLNPCHLISPRPPLSPLQCNLSQVPQQTCCEEYLLVAIFTACQCCCASLSAWLLILADFAWSVCSVERNLLTGLIGTQALNCTVLCWSCFLGTYLWLADNMVTTKNTSDYSTTGDGC